MASQRPSVPLAVQRSCACAPRPTRMATFETKNWHTELQSDTHEENVICANATLAGGQTPLTRDEDDRTCFMFAATLGHEKALSCMLHIYTQRADRGGGCVGIDERDDDGEPGPLR